MEENPYRAPTIAGAKARRRRLRPIARANLIFFGCIAAAVLMVGVLLSLDLLPSFPAST